MIWSYFQLKKFDNIFNEKNMLRLEEIYNFCHFIYVGRLRLKIL